MVIRPISINENPVEKPRLRFSWQQRVVWIQNALVPRRHETDPTLSTHAQSGDTPAISLAGNRDDNQILGHMEKVGRRLQNSRI